MSPATPIPDNPGTASDVRSRPEPDQNPGRARRGDGVALPPPPPGFVTVQQAYRFALDPTPGQARRFASHAGGARVAYNQGITWIAEALDARAAETAAGTKPSTKVPGHFDLCKQWTAYKNDPESRVHAWAGENFVGTYQAALRDAHVAWKAFFDARAGRRKGTAGRPRYKKKGRSRDSFQVHGSTLAVADARHVKLPKIGLVRTHEPTRKLRRRINKGTARIIRGTVSRTADRWFISFTVELYRQDRRRPSARQRAGGGVGVAIPAREPGRLAEHLAVLTAGETVETVPNPRHFDRDHRRLAAAQRTAARRRPKRGQAASNGYRQAARRVARLHAGIADRRADATHKLTSRLVHRHGALVVEDLPVLDLTRSGRGTRGNPGRDVRAKANANRLVLDAAPATLRTQLAYKAGWYGAAVYTISDVYPTSTPCPACGAATAKLRLDRQGFECATCQTTLDPSNPSDPSGDARVTPGMRAALALVGQVIRPVHPTTGAPSGGEPLNARGAGVSPPRSGPPGPAGRQPAPKREARTDLPGNRPDGSDGHPRRVTGGRPPPRPD